MLILIMEEQLLGPALLHLQFAVVTLQPAQTGTPWLPASPWRSNATIGNGSSNRRCSMNRNQYGIQDVTQHGIQYGPQDGIQNRTCSQDE